MIQDFEEWFYDGCGGIAIVPVGECPKCGALVHRDSDSSLFELMKSAPDLLQALDTLMGGDPKMQVAIGGNPNYVDRFLDNTRSLIRRLK